MSKQQKNNTAVEPVEIKKAASPSEQTALPTAEEPITTIPTEKKQLTVTEPKPSKGKPAKETVTAIPLERIQPFENHPFRVEADAAMAELKRITEKGINKMSDSFDFDDDGQVSPEEEAMAFLLIDDDEEEELINSHGCGCLPMVLLIVGVTAAAVTLRFLM